MVSTSNFTESFFFFVHLYPDTDDSKECHELLSMSQVLSHILNSAEPLVKVRN